MRDAADRRYAGDSGCEEGSAAVVAMNGRKGGRDGCQSENCQNESYWIGVSQNREMPKSFDFKHF